MELKIIFSKVTTQYHLHTDDFSQDCVRSCTVQRLDNYGGISESVDRQSCYLMRVDEMYAEVGKDQIIVSCKILFR